MSMFKRLFLLIISLGFLAGALPQNAQAEMAPEQYTKLRVLAERIAIQPGDEIWIGTQQNIAPEWHTYWRNPGDSGAPPRLNWSLPDGFEISEIHWPAPEKLPYIDMMNYGYSDQVILLQKLTVPDSLPDGPITLSMAAEVLVCKDICIPEFSTHTLTLNNPLNMQEDNSAFLDYARAKLPIPVSWQATYTEKENDLILTITPDDPEFFAITELSDVELLPVEWGLVSNTAYAAAKKEAGKLIVIQPREERPLDEAPQTEIVLSYTNNNGDLESVSLTAYRGDIKTPYSANTYKGGLSNTSLITALLFALLGGLILNLMPCVFPVLSLKALSLAKMAGNDPAMTRLSGLAYTAGVVLSFLAVAGALIAFKTAGAQIGWGFQLQNPMIITLLAYLLFMIGLNLTGFFEITGHFGSIGQRLTQGNGLSNSFFTGVLATIVATPCTAPFMALAIGYALIQPATIALLIFATLGFGLALPYLVLSFVPAFQRILPKPGPWMDTFRKILSIPMFGFSLWLLSILAVQASPAALIPVLIGFAALALSFWLLTHEPKQVLWRRIAQIIAVLGFIAALAVVPTQTKHSPATKQSQSFGQEYSPEALATALLTDDPVFVEMTAAWCITCKVNHRLAINIESTKTLLRNHNVQYLIGDWTNYDPHITEFLNSYGRNGVPIYVYYGPRNKKTGERPEAKLLPQILTPKIVAKVITP